MGDEGGEQVERGAEEPPAGRKKPGKSRGKRGKKKRRKPRKAGEGKARRGRKPRRARPAPGAVAPAAATEEPVGPAADGEPAEEAKEERREEPSDTVVTVSGRRIACRIRVVNSRSVSFYPLGERKAKSLKRDRVNRVIYRDGRIDKITALAVQDIDEGDWRIVIVTEDEAMVHGLYPKGVVKAESRSTSGSMARARQNAETRLKKQVIKKGGTYVLVKDRKTRGGYGEIPTYTIEGEAFGTEPGNVDSAASEEKSPKRRRHGRRSRRRR